MVITDASAGISASTPRSSRSCGSGTNGDCTTIAGVTDPGSCGTSSRPRAWSADWLVASALRWRIPLIIAAYVVTFAAIYWLAYLIRFDGVVPLEELAP